MKDIIYVLINIIVYSAQGLLFVMLWQAAQKRFRFSYKYMSEAILLVQ